MKKTCKYYWEDFTVGSVRDHGGMVLSQEDILRFAREFDPQPFHVDETAASESIFGGLIASGWHTCALAMRMMCDAYLLESASLGSPGVDSIKWLKPVRPGDTLRLRTTVLEARPLESKPNIGLIRSQWQVYNQQDECVMEMQGYGMFRRRPEA
ncbi:MAG: MaoC family dehydratase [Betaproteobacteria bacterium]|nr:MaoC family dehydratase [Betaproteobacteria bacterium]